MGFFDRILGRSSETPAPVPASARKLADDIARLQALHLLDYEESYQIAEIGEVRLSRSGGLQWSGDAGRGAIRRIKENEYDNSRVAHLFSDGNDLGPVGVTEGGDLELPGSAPAGLVSDAMRSVRMMHHDLARMEQEFGHEIASDRHQQEMASRRGEADIDQLAVRAAADSIRPARPKLSDEAGEAHVEREQPGPELGR
jgi:hypothetical protein